MATVKLVLAVLLGLVIVGVLMVAAAYLWVFVYSALIDTTGDAAYYEAYAQRASPIVALVVALPCFYLMTRVMRAMVARAALAAYAVLVINLILDIAVTLGMAQDLAYTATISLVVAVLKYLGVRLGLRASPGAATASG